MIGLQKTVPILICTSLAWAAPTLMAQSGGFGSFALSIDEQVSTTHQHDLNTIVEFENTEFVGNYNSISVLLDNPSLIGGGYIDISPTGADDSDSHGSDLRSIDARNSFEPKNDELSIVPLPSAVLAGFGLLAGLAGARFIRKNNR